MAINKKNRKDLKSYFVKNAIPTEGNFAELIDAQLNQADDGVFKLDNEPLSVIAAPGDQRRVLRLYGAYPAQNPDWLISLNPAQNPANPATTRPGFGITDGAGNTRLFIDPATGNIGIGTNKPEAKLDVVGKIKARGGLDVGGGPLKVGHSASISGNLGLGIESPSSKLTVQSGNVRIQGGRYRRLEIVSDQYWAGIELVARQDGENGHPHIDFTHGDLDAPNYGIRLWSPSNTELQIDGGPLRVPGGLRVDGDVPHIDADGAIYRSGGQVYVTVDDHLYIRDSGSNTWAANFRTNEGDLFLKGGLNTSGFSTIRGVAVNDGQNTGVGRGVWLWGPTDSNHVIYSANTGGKSPANAGPAAGYFDGTQRMRFRTATGQGFLFENNAEKALVDIDSDDGRLWARGAIHAGNSDIYFTNTEHNHSAIGNTLGYAAIENAKNYDALMLLGRKTADGPRVVKVWDYMQVVGKLDATEGAELRNIGIGTQVHGETKYPYETIQLSSGHNLRFWFGTTERFIMQNNGQLQIRFNGGYWVFQTDGNLVKYRSNGQALWASGAGW